MIDNMKTFRMVVEAQGFRSAATQLGISAAVVSRRIDRLEHYLKVKLLQRNTRGFSLTEAGQQFYRTCVSMTDQFVSCVNELQNLEVQAAGRLKIGIPHSLNHLYVLPALADFIKYYPQLKLDIAVGNHSVELFTHGYDLAIHCGVLPDSNLYFTSLGQWRKCTVASPDYLERFGSPAIPSNLLQHRCLMHLDNYRQSWNYMSTGHIIEQPLTAHLRLNSSMALLDATLQGLGICYLPEFVVRESVSQGLLVTLLDEFMPCELPMYVVHVNAKPTRNEFVFIEFLRSLNMGL
ncbi:MAG: HTH-type transcriptional regulator PgrR [Candidatus Celerinatantimonas neptuna]|nr:MAG: HTH-type transcriptional regulator PgrR [Candidatus Celerinatantimonas neptuna]